MAALEDIRTALQGATVDILGNGPSATQWTAASKSPRVVTVNAGLRFLDALNADADLIWIQDERFLIEKPESFFPYIERAHAIAINAASAYLLPRSVSDRTVPIQMLDYVGYSDSPATGLFHGYNVVYGLLQLLHWCGVRSVNVYGVGLDYWTKNPRIGQSVRGGDVDMHRASHQVVLVRQALARLMLDGIDVHVHGSSTLNHARLIEQPLWGVDVPDLHIPSPAPVRGLDHVS